jgi:DNA invertase Pin-like site-specific DNA recombinase
MRIVVYLRVSTDKQAEQGQGLDVQEDVCRAWIREHGHRLVAIEADEGRSGTDALADREGLAGALAAIRDGTAQGLVIYKLDRLARDLILQEQLIREIRHAGGDIFTTSAGESGYLADEPGDPSRKLIRQILGAVSEYERSMIVLRMQAGRAMKARQGGYAYGAPRYGQRADRGELVQDPAELQVITRMARDRAQGASLRDIANMLNTEGITGSRGRPWHPATVSRVLSRANS